MYVYTIKTAPIPPCPAPAPPEGKVLLLLLLLLLFCSSPINGGTSNCIYKKYISILLLYIYYRTTMWWWVRVMWCDVMHVFTAPLAICYFYPFTQNQKTSVSQLASHVYALLLCFAYAMLCCAVLCRAVLSWRELGPMWVSYHHNIGIFPAPHRTTSPSPSLSLSLSSLSPLSLLSLSSLSPPTYFPSLIANPDPPQGAPRPT